MDTSVYKIEAIELLDELEAALMLLEENPDDTETINRIFRALHTIKGSGKMFGFDDIAEFTHDLETSYDALRSGRLEVTSELITQTLSACDIIRRMLYGEYIPKEESNILLRYFSEISSPDKSQYKTMDQKSNQQELTSAGTKATYRLQFKPHLNIFASGTNVSSLLEEVSSLGDATIVCHDLEVPDMESINPENCYLGWDIVLTTACNENIIRDIFIFVEDQCELKIKVVEDAMDMETGEGGKRIGEILLEKGDLSQEQLEDTLKTRKRIGEELVEKKVVTSSQIRAALAEQEHNQKNRAVNQEVVATSSVRVAAEKLDSLVNLVGELVIVQARLTQHSNTLNNFISVGIAEEIERLTAELRDNTMSLRMLPIGTIFSKFKRLVRDLSRELGKDIELIMDGGETELDKSVIDQLSDPLIHIIRNSLDHGIEAPEVRSANNKKPTGTIRLSAQHSGASVILCIADDGAGLDSAAISKKAIAKGIITEEQSLSDEQLFQLIFEPGFSTADCVSDISGRGVGMDVVRKSVEALRGYIDISSRPGAGTKIVITLPLTMAIIDGLLVETGGDRYVIPQAMVQECFEQTHDDIEKFRGSNVMKIRGQMMPYICLRQRFNIQGDIPQSRRVILCEAGDRKIGVAVDRVIGYHQTVIKPLGTVYKHIECISGATILGDGGVALILDPAKMLLEQGRSQLKSCS